MRLLLRAKSNPVSCLPTMKTFSLFPTSIYQDSLGSKARKLNAQLLQEIEVLSIDDKAGISWSQKNYLNGYTSYASANQMQKTSPTFTELEECLTPHVKKYLNKLHFQSSWKNLKMTTCWVNIMNPGCAHSLHIHPQSVISGTYYVSLPKGASTLRFEDPRYAHFMNRPPVTPQSPYQTHICMQAKSRDFILFESWLRHDVPVNTQKAPRISISFNYE